MNIDELMALRNSSEAPFNHQEYTVWLHNKIVDKINYDLWQYREKPNTIAKNGYSVCNDIISIPSLKRIS